MDVLEYLAAALPHLLELLMGALGDKAVSTLAFLGEGCAVDQQLLIMQQDVSDSDRRAIELAERSDTVHFFLHLMQGDVEREVFVQLTVHNFVVTDHYIFNGAVGEA